MKTTFEEKFTAWVDGELKGEELISFEAELVKTEDAEIERVAALQLGGLLREHGQARELQNADFFNHRIMQEIETGMPKPKAKRERPRFSWSLPRIALAGAFSLLVAFGLFHYVIPVGPQQGPQGIAEVIKVQSNDKDITASAFYSQKNDVTVLWLDGPKFKAEKKHDSDSKK